MLTVIYAECHLQALYAECYGAKGSTVNRARILIFPAQLFFVNIALNVLKPFCRAMRGNQVPVSAGRWQHWSQQCFATFIQYKITNLLITQEPLKLEKKIRTYLESLEFQKFFDIRLTEFENNQILLNKISYRFLVTTKLFSG